MTNVMCKEIRQVRGGFIIQLRWPFGPDPGGYGEVICKTWDEVVENLRKTVLDTEAR